MPSWLSDWVGTDMALPASYALAAVIVLVLIVVVLSVARKVMGSAASPRAKNRGPRLAVMDIASIDPKRKLILVRRDEIEHLILIGGQNDLVVEAGILRVPANARVQRNEPTLRPDVEVAGDALRAERQPQQDPRTRRAPPAPVAVQPPVPAPQIDTAARPPEPRSGSPLARPVPRPAPAPAPTLRPEPAITVPPVEAPPARPQQPPVRAPEATVPPVVAVEPPRPENRPVAAETQRSDPAPAAAPPVEPPGAASPVRPNAPPVELPAPSAAAPVPRTPIAPESIRPAGPSAVEPMPRNGSRNSVDDAPRPMRPTPAPPAIPRVAVGGVNEPLRRPLPTLTVQPIQPIQPVQPRSMATPTYPARQAASASAGPAPRPEDGGPAGDGKQTDIVLAGLLAQGASAPIVKESDGTSTDRDAATETASAEVRADPGNAAEERPGPTVDMPAADGSLGTGAAEPKPTVLDLGEPADRRPLSVRSFASTIQTRTSQGEAASAPSQAATPPVPATSPVASPIVARQDPEPSVQAIKAPGARMVFPVRGTAQPIPLPPPPVADSADDADLEDFLSAQLNTELNDDIWAVNEVPKVDTPISGSAPPVMPDSPIPAVEAPRVEIPRVEAPRVEAPKIEAPRSDEPRTETPRVEVIEPRVSPPREPTALGKPRTLTLEEEMERLLGDFDLETTDRRLR